MLTGRLPDGHMRKKSLTLAVLLSVVLIPLEIAACAMIYAGIKALRTDGDLSAASGAGIVILLLLVLLFWYILWRLPNITIQEFTLKNNVFTYRTRRGSWSYPLEDLRNVYIVIQRQTPRGWWVYFKSSGYLWIDPETPNANELVEVFSSRVKVRYY
jgi:hypothetical protein